MDRFDRITSDPEILEGRAIVRGTRMSVEDVVSMFRGGMKVAEILREHPSLEKEDVWQCIRFYAAALAGELDP